MKNFIKMLQQDADNLVKEAGELREIFALSGREALLADKEAMADLKEPVEKDYEAELEAEYDGSQQQAQDDYDRTEMQAIRNNM